MNEEYTQEYKDLDAKYDEIFGYSPSLTIAYVMPTIEDLKRCIETKTEFDFYEGLPEGAVV